MDPPPHLVAFAPPSETDLLGFAQTKVSREMIHEIAKNDRERDISTYELGISRQLAPKPELGLSIWIKIGEVLSLEQVSEPDRAYENSPPEGIKGHLKRLFACTILLRNAGYVSIDENPDGDFFLEISAGSVIQLVRSALAIGDRAPRRAIGFLLWFHDKQSDPLVRPYAAFGVLVLEAQENPASAAILETCSWVEEEEIFARRQLGRDVYSDHWLLGINYQESKRNGERWVNALAQVIEANRGRLATLVESRLRDMLARMSQ